MSHITLIRHGQANTEARDEESYDKLSPLGHQQAGWLGDYLRASGQYHPRVYCGSLTRHLETAQSMGFADGIVEDPRLNELAYFTLAQLMEEQHGIPMPVVREEFAVHLPRLFNLWQQGQIEDAPESFDSFVARISGALSDIAKGKGPSLVVTSGGLIAMTMRHVMGLDIAATARMALAIMNTSVHRLHPIGEHLSPVLFNAVPHLDLPDRHFAQTHF